MKTSELKLLSKQELQNLLSEKKDALSKFYFKVAKGRVKNLKEGKETKKDIARILTLLNLTDANIRIDTNNTNKM